MIILEKVGIFSKKKPSIHGWVSGIHKKKTLPKYNANLQFQTYNGDYDNNVHIQDMVGTYECTLDLIITMCIKCEQMPGLKVQYLNGHQIHDK